MDGFERGAFASPVDLINEARNGRMVILVDDEGRENEGDLIIPAQMATPDAINFMAKHGRGLICLALTRERVGELGLDLMARADGGRDPLETAFTLSIEASNGVTTGISAADRARTIAVAIDRAYGPADIVTPGHIFPLSARTGGVLVRAGHTEAAVDISRLAGLNPSGVICEIMNDDGTMARRDDLIAFSQLHGIKLGTIQDLIAYRCRHDRLVEKVEETVIDSPFGGRWRTMIYRDTIEGWEHTVLQKGEIGPDQPVMVRMHDLSLFGDILGEIGNRQFALQRAMMMVAEEGRGLVVALRTPRIDPLAYRLKRRREGHDVDLRNYGIGAQILADLNVGEMILVTSGQHRNIVGLQGYGLKIVEERPLPQNLEGWVAL
nr:3,4-dihydroxy-2-butanone-4-phosphate synthase [Sphingomonas sp. CDS-1]